MKKRSILLLIILILIGCLVFYFLNSGNESNHLRHEPWSLIK